MRLIILSAGMGSRLFPLILDIPKSLLDLGNGSTLLERQLNSAIACSQIKSIYIATGYQHQKIESFLQQLDKKFSNIYLEYNPFFEMADNFITLWSIRHLFIDEDFIISNGDNLYKDYILKHIVESTEGLEGVFVTIDKKEHYDNDDMKIIMNNAGDVLRVHKQINPQEAMAESVGLVLVKGNAARSAFLDAVLTLIKNKECCEYYWLEILNHLIKVNFPVKSVLINKTDWCELDFHPDVNFIRESMLKNLF